MAEAMSLPWTVAIVGKWNRAIVTPQWVAENLFEITDLVGDPSGVELEVPVDVVGPYRLGRDGVVVMTDDGKVSIEVPDGRKDKLTQALKMCRKAIQMLPRTPYTSALITLHFEIHKCNPEADFWCKWDNALKLANYQIETREALRRLAWRQGYINIRLRHRINNAAEVFLQFEKRSREPEKLVEWLSISVEDVTGEAGAFVKMLESGVLQ